jgi:alanyl-tRNA synthetase
MGIERAAVVTLGLQSIYDTDLFRPIIRAAERVAGVEYGKEWDTDYALRVLADHGRAITFLVLDGVVPGNGGREYVLRRILRRAIVYGRRLGIDRPFLAEIVDAVLARMGDHYPDLQTDAARIKHVVSAEEELFSRTLQAGSAQIDRLVANARDKAVSGRDVFDLYQTFGFPVELTEEVLRERGITFDRAEFEAALDAERERARSVARFHVERQTGDSEFGHLPQTEFLAWTAQAAESRILAHTGTQLILEASPFYPEGGGQVGDTGWVRTPGGVFEVEDTQADGTGHVVHYGKVVEGEIQVGELARAEVDAQRRDRSRRHHTATHLLHRALKDVLGEVTSQQGSYVGPDQLRFDFNSQQPMARDQLQEVASIVNDRSMDDLTVHWDIVSMEQARAMRATMMFGEKYGERVRVVSIGEYSRELCGGTHTHHSGELGSFVIASESGIGSGKRRIVAYAGQPALNYLNRRLHLLETLTERVGARSPDELEARIDSALAEIESLRREVERRRQQQARESAHDLVSRARRVRDIDVVAASVEGASQDDLKKLVDAVRQDLRSGVVILGSVQDGRVPVVVGVTADLTSRLHAGQLVRAVASAMGGGGGGNRADFATGSGTQPAKLGAALQHAYTVVEQALEND